MCGLTGFCSKKDLSEQFFQNTLSAMNSALSHRGPDGRGIWFDETAGVGFAHRRLSILDLSANGHQPMLSKNGKYVIIFNGEIYNHQELRKDLKSVYWAGTSDTETLIEHIAIYGLKKTLSLVRGMFAFALWNKDSGEIILARDRFGEKPLYYGFLNETFMFASELKSLTKHPAFKKEIDQEALSSFLKLSYVPSPKSIYKNISKLEQGSYLVFNSQTLSFQKYKYWDLVNASAGETQPHRQFSEVESINSLDYLLNDVVKEQMLSDVPLGAFLSGGIDSSTIVAMMQSQSMTQIKTFTVGFEDKAFDESDNASAIASYLGTDHSDFKLSTGDFLSVVPKIHEIFDEPFADSSQIPTYLVSQLAAKDVKVTLSGDAGDEIFSGYNRYRFAKNIWPSVQSIPYPMRSYVSKLLSKLSVKQVESLISLFPFFKKNFSSTTQKIYKIAEILNSNSLESYYDRLISQTNMPSEFMHKGNHVPNDRQAKHANLDNFADFEKLMIYDSLGYLPDDILVKLDRASMHVSLESRVPYLDPRISEFVWKLPENMKIRGSVTKYILRQVLRKYLPENLINVQKMGFSIPLDSWLRGPLRSWSEDLLDRESIKNKGYLDYDSIISVWQKHKNGDMNAGPILWNILMFQLWVEDH
tara:strand:+ start:48029 stop:49957 length:1929 start_codon:yes stop_codon:yes gene_type:complete